MRNLGGAIGIAAIDTVIYTRAPEHAQTIVSRLTAGDMDTVRSLDIPPDVLASAMLDPGKHVMLAPYIDRVAFVEAINEAWALVAVLTIAALVALPLARRAPKAAAIDR
jgi:DHA2 family multidrug resistance protein